jgi:hypothetical protein
MSRSISIYTLALSIIILSGCSKPGPQLIEVRGKVTYQGKPVTQGSISFSPKSSAIGGLRPAQGGIKSDGSFEMQSLPGKKGVQPGEYLVAINSYTGSFIEGDVVYIVPKRFSEASSSGLTVTLPKEENSVEKNFDLK